MAQSRGPLVERMLLALYREYTFEQWTRDHPLVAADAWAKGTHDLAVTLTTEVWDLERPWNESLFLEWSKRVRGLNVGPPAILTSPLPTVDIDLDTVFAATGNVPAASFSPLGRRPSRSFGM